MTKADFSQAEIYNHYLIVPVRCEDSGLWTASWLDADNLLQMSGGTPLDFAYQNPIEAITALKPILDRYSNYRSETPVA